jgi:hypothetical protein
MPALANRPADTAASLRPYRDYRGGTRKPMRPCPPDFREMFLRYGWDRAIEEHYRANWRVILRWIEESGGEELREARAAISGRPMAPHRRSRLPTYAEAVAAQAAQQPALAR